MFTFRRLTVLFFVLLLGLNILKFSSGYLTSGLSGLSWFLAHQAATYALLAIGYLGISFAMAFLPCSNFHHPVNCSGQTTQRVLAITFDDGPHPVHTPEVLKTLKKHGVPAAFFCVGNRLPGQEELIGRMVSDGHVIGNHSYSHSNWFDLFPAKKIRAELLETDRLITGITGKPPAFFRPPYGVVNPMVSRALKGMHWVSVCWNIRSFDTVIRDPEKITGRIMKRLKPGAIILLHDHTVFSTRHLDALLSKIKTAGFAIIALDQLINKPTHE